MEWQLAQLRAGRLLYLPDPYLPRHFLIMA